jgi:hypothetical protein
VNIYAPDFNNLRLKPEPEPEKPAPKSVSTK